MARGGYFLFWFCFFFFFLHRKPPFDLLAFQTMPHKTRRSRLGSNFSTFLHFSEKTGRRFLRGPAVLFDSFLGNENLSWLKVYLILKTDSFFFFCLFCLSLTNKVLFLSRLLSGVHSSKSKNKQFDRAALNSLIMQKIRPPNFVANT